MVLNLHKFLISIQKNKTETKNLYIIIYNDMLDGNVLWYVYLLSLSHLDIDNGMR